MNLSFYIIFLVSKSVGSHGSVIVTKVLHAHTLVSSSSSSSNGWWLGLVRGFRDLLDEGALMTTASGESESDFLAHQWTADSLPLLDSFEKLCLDKDASARSDKRRCLSCPACLNALATLIWK